MYCQKFYLSHTERLRCSPKSKEGEVEEREAKQRRKQVKENEDKNQ